MDHEEYRDIVDFLRRFVRRFRAVRALEALSVALIAFLVLFSLGLGVETIKGLLPYAPLVYSVLAPVILLGLAAFTLFGCLRPHALEWAARIVERQRPELRNNLINSLQLYPGLKDRWNADHSSAPMILALVRQTRQQLAALRPEELVNTAALTARLKLVAGLAVPVMALIVWHPALLGQTLMLIAHPLKDLPPAEIFIHVATKDARVIRGTGITIEAATSGAKPDAVDLVFRPAKPAESAESRSEKLAMRPLPGEEQKFRGIVSRVAEDLEYRVVAGPFASPWYTIAAVDRPAIAHMKVTLYPPHYTGLPTETILGGNIRGVKGSTLSFDAKVNKDLAQAKVVMDDGREVPLKVHGRNAQGSMVLFRSQQYRIRLEDPFGFANLPIPHEMRVIPDGFPTVELLQPSDDLEVNGDENLSLDYSARDDYGVQEITLVAKVGDREERVPVWRDEPQRTQEDRFGWDLNALGLDEGDVVTYHLEVLDNDTISGPKVGKSRPLTLRLKNLKAEHRKVADMIRELSDEMLDLLGDHLESPSLEERPAGEEPQGARNLAEGLDRMARRVDEVMKQTRTDRMSDFATWSDLEKLKRNLDYTRNDLLERMNQASSAEEREATHDAMSTELERMSMLSEDIGKRLTGQNIASTAQDMLKSQERFLDSLEKLRSGNKELDAVLKELAELSQQLQELQNSLAQFARQVPDEFLNRDSMRNMPFTDMRSAMQEIRKKLQEGDIEAALQMARELFNQMAQMVASLRGSQQQAQNSMMGRMQNAMSRSKSELQQILQEQQSILQETEESHKEITGELNAKLAEALEKFEEKSQRQLAALTDAFANRPQTHGSSPDADTPGVENPNSSIDELISAMKAMLAEKDFPALSKQMALVLEELKKYEPDSLSVDQQDAMVSLEALSEQHRQLHEMAVPELTPEQAKGVRRLANRQMALESRTTNLTERMRNLFQLFPSLDPTILKNIEEAGVFMGAAGTELGRLDTGTAIPPEEQAIQRLSQSNQQMQSAMQQLARRGQMGRVPLVYMFRRGRFMPSGRLVPLPGDPQFPDFDMDEGITGLDTEKFKLPGKDDYKPEKFREEILDSLKQGVPAQFKEQVESYFKELAQ